MFGSETTRIQTVLGMWGFYGGEVDGKMGKGTATAIRRFKRYMLEIDPNYGATATPEPTATPNPNGMFGDMPIVNDELIVSEASRDLADEAVTPALMEYVDGDKDFTIFRKSIATGDTGSEALRVQTRLHQLKYVYGADGNFGELSVLGLKYFQRKNDLPETGVADRATQELLFSNRAIMMSRLS